ncbi:MAG TPA: nucleotidyl transferase AbiEii/AbiGii toxin family protein [Acidimicrobiales bacterium]
MLTPLQEQIAQIIGDALEGSDFALAGGAALISQGLVDRRTRDLDFFGSSSPVLSERLQQIIHSLVREGFQVEIDQQNERFVRLEVTGLGEETDVDFGIDSRLFPPDQGAHSLVLSSRELAVDKVLAIFGRAEPRDFVDLAALTQFFDIEELFAEAVRKDRGFNLAVFAEMTSRFNHLPRREFPMSDAAFDELKVTTASWRDIAHRLDREHDRGLGR